MNKIYRDESGFRFSYKDFLSEEDFLTIVSETVDAFMEGLETKDGDNIKDNISSYKYNLCCSKLRFNRVLGSLCIEGFNTDLNKQIYEKGLYEDLFKMIKNVDEARKTIDEIINNIQSVSSLLDSFLKNLPNKEDLNSLPQQYNSAIEKYKEIVKEPKEDGK